MREEMPMYLSRFRDFQIFEHRKAQNRLFYLIGETKIISIWGTQNKLFYLIGKTKTMSI